MAILKSKDALKMDLKSRNDKFKELKIELMKSQSSTQKSGGKTKEIKRAIARLKTLNTIDARKKN